MQTIELIKPGTYTAMGGQEITFSDADLRATAEAYSPQLSEAPLVIGHPQTDAPAYGWVANLGFSAWLEAEPHQVDPAFAEIVNAGRYKKISASFYPPSAKNNPKPGIYYLRHVGFLGAQPPAVKGGRDAHFADADNMITIDLAEPSKRRKEDRTMPAAADNPPDLATIAAAEKLAAANKKLADEQSAFGERVKSFDAEQKRLRHEGIVQFAANQVKAARILPKDRPGLIAFMDAVPADLTVELAEDGGEKTKHDGLEWFRSFVAGLPSQVEFGEHARAENAGETVVNFATPPGYSVAPDRMAIHRKAMAYRQAHPQTDYVTAILAVTS